MSNMRKMDVGSMTIGMDKGTNVRNTNQLKGKASPTGKMNDTNSTTEYTCKVGDMSKKGAR